MRLRHNRPAEYPATPIDKLKGFRTRYGNEGMAVMPAPGALLTDRDRRAIQLESAGYTLIQTFVQPTHEEPAATPIGNLSIILHNKEQDAARLAVDSILWALATERMAMAVEEYGAGNVAICRTMRYQPLQESVYEPYEYMALYVRIEEPRQQNG